MICSSEAWTYFFIGYFPSESGFAWEMEALDEAKRTLVCEGVFGKINDDGARTSL